MIPEARVIFKRLRCSGYKLGLEHAADVVNAYCTRADLNEYQYGALCLFVENRGARAFYQSKLLKIVNEDFESRWQLRAGREFLKPQWYKWDGKINKRMKERREAEHRLWSTPELIYGEKQ